MVNETLQSLYRLIVLVLLCTEIKLLQYCEQSSCIHISNTTLKCWNGPQSQTILASTYKTPRRFDNWSKVNLGRFETIFAKSLVYVAADVTFALSLLITLKRSHSDWLLHRRLKVCSSSVMYTINWQSRPRVVKMLGLYLYTLIIGHTFFDMLSILNKLPL